MTPRFGTEMETRSSAFQNVSSFGLKVTGSEATTSEGEAWAPPCPLGRGSAITPFIPAGDSGVVSVPRPVRHLSCRKCSDENARAWIAPHTTTAVPFRATPSSRQGRAWRSRLISLPQPSATPVRAIWRITPRPVCRVPYLTLLYPLVTCAGRVQAFFPLVSEMCWRWNGLLKNCWISEFSGNLGSRKKKKKENQSERRIFCPSLLAPSRGGRHAMTGGLPRRAFGQLVEGVLGPLAGVHEPFFLFSTR